MGLEKKAGFHAGLSLLIPIGATANGEPCIKIYTASQPEKLRNKVPQTVEDYPIIIEQTGTFQAFTSEQ